MTTVQQVGVWMLIVVYGSLAWTGYRQLRKRGESIFDSMLIAGSGLFIVTWSTVALYLIIAGAS